jgi:hypothetical protein
MALPSTSQKTERDLGRSDTKTLAEMFPAFPADDYDPKAFMKSLLAGIQSGNPDLGSFSMDYANAPAIEEFAPNPSSPGPGDTNPRNKPPAPSDWPPPASDFGSVQEPKDTSAEIAEQDFENLNKGSH